MVGLRIKENMAKAKGDNMPKVGSKKYSYTKSGYKAARKEAKKTGKKMTTPRRKPAKKTTKK